MDCKQYQQYVLADSQDENSKKTREWIEVDFHSSRIQSNPLLDFDSVAMLSICDGICIVIVTIIGQKNQFRFLIFVCRT